MTHPTAKFAHQSFLIGVLLVACSKCWMSGSVQELNSVNMYDHVLTMYVCARDSRSMNDDEVVVMIDDDLSVVCPFGPLRPLMGNDDGLMEVSSLHPSDRVIIIHQSRRQQRTGSQSIAMILRQDVSSS